MTQKTPEITPTSEKIDKLISRIKSGDIKIPVFQRAYVWKQNQIIELLDSIVNNYPIGSVLLWESKEKLKHTRDIAGFQIPDFKEEYPVNYVLDGQQRLSTIYAVFSRNKGLIPELFNIYFSFKEKRFIVKDELSNNSDFVIRLRDLLDIPQLMGALRLLNKDFHSDAQLLVSTFLNYEVPVVTIKNRNKEEVGVIFERINNTGTKLGVLDLMTAWTWTDDFHLEDKIKKLFEELDRKSFGNVSESILLQTLSGMINSDTRSNSIISIKGELFRDNWEVYCESLRKSIDFLSTEIKCKNISFLPYPQQMAGLIKFFFLKKRPNLKDLKALKRWFWQGAFSNKYSLGTTTLRMNKDIADIKKIIENDYSSLDSYDLALTANDLIKTKFSKASSKTRAFLLLMAQFHPIDLSKGVAVDLEKSLSSYNRKEYHHVFPNKYLVEQGTKQSKIFSLMNFCFLPADSNKQISKKAPSDYFFSIVNTSDFEKILTSNLLPLKKDIYYNNNYDLFLDERAKNTIEEIKNRI